MESTIGEILMSNNNYRFFKTYSISLNDKEKENLYNEYFLIVAVFSGGFETPLSYDDYFNQVGFYERINMRCLHCRYRQTLHFSIYKHLIRSNEITFPSDICPKCNKEHFVPEDIYNTLMNNIIK